LKQLNEKMTNIGLNKAHFKQKQQTKQKNVENYFSW
jgi:hypothetical protein